MAQISIPPTIDSLWNFQEPEKTEQKFRELLKEYSLDDNNHDYAYEVHTQIARTFSLRGDFETAHKELDAVKQSLGALSRRVQARYYLERGRTFNSANKRDDAIEHFTKLAVKPPFSNVGI